MDEATQARPKVNKNWPPSHDVVMQWAAQKWKSVSEGYMHHQPLWREASETGFTEPHWATQYQIFNSAVLSLTSRNIVVLSEGRPKTPFFSRPLFFTGIGCCPHFLCCEKWREIQMGNCLYCKMGQQPNFREYKMAVNLNPSLAPLERERVSHHSSFHVFKGRV